MNCKYVARDKPRVLPRRHADDCAGEECGGCLPCTEPHCRVCGKEHAEQTCAACVGEAREDLVAIGDLCRNLPAEAIHRGIDSEAMSLMGPAADAEAWGHITTSLHVGRLPAGYLACDRCDAPYPCAKHADGELHPLSTLGTWEMVWRDALDHETDAVVTIPAAVAYLGQQLTYMAGFEDAPFEDFARDLRRCRAHLESVLHDGEQIDEGAPCMKCDATLRKVYMGRELPWSTSDRPVSAIEDGWACPRCKRWHNAQQYRLAVTATHLEHAPALTAPQLHRQYAIKPGSVRGWASLGKVRKRGKDASGVTLYDVSDACAMQDANTKEAS